MKLSDLKLVKLNGNTVMKSFNCIDKDLNEFLLDDAINYSNELLTVTYLFEIDTKTVAYFSLLNDRINLKVEKTAIRNRINRNIPNQKRINSYPAVKIGRLAVLQEFSRQNIGSQIVDFLKALFVTDNRTGCRFITVDGYRVALSFYEKNGFKYLTENDVEDDTRLMYYDLKKFTKGIS